jgi:hypothetical protein
VTAPKPDADALLAADLIGYARGRDAARAEIDRLTAALDEEIDHGRAVAVTVDRLLRQLLAARRQIDADAARAALDHPDPLVDAVARARAHLADKSLDWIDRATLARAALSAVPATAPEPSDVAGSCDDPTAWCPEHAPFPCPSPDAPGETTP